MKTIALRYVSRFLLLVFAVLMASMFFSCAVSKNKQKEKEEIKVEVKYDKRKAQFTTDEYWLWSIVEHSEIIGNIHDNPELLEVEE